jgi:hypothetical protein
MELEDELSPASMTLLFPSVAESMVVVGGDVSTVHVNDAEEGSLFPTLSRALISKVYCPSSDKLGNVNGLVQVTKVKPSTLHSK